MNREETLGWRGGEKRLDGCTVLVEAGIPYEMVELAGLQGEGAAEGSGRGVEDVDGLECAWRNHPSKVEGDEYWWGDGELKQIQMVFQVSMKVATLITSLVEQTPWHGLLSLVSLL